MKKILLFVFLVAGVECCFAFDVEDVLWGYNGKVVAGKFNPCSVMVSNLNKEPFDGYVLLSKRSSGGSAVGAPLVKHLYLGPFAKKWIQFYPYIRDDYGEWYLRIKGTSNRYKLPRPGNGVPAEVAMVDANFLLRQSRLFRFPEHLFPVCLPMTETLSAALLDHMPQFSPAQKKTFIQWIKAGGTAFVAKRGDYYPVFSEELDVLNGDYAEKALGNGRVVKLNMAGSQVAMSDLHRTGYASPVKVKRRSDDYDSFRLYDNPVDKIFQQLRSLVRTNHSWGIIFFLACIYLALIGPVNYFVARRTRNYRSVILFFVIVVAAFSLLFSYIGRRGYGERSIINSLSYAHHVEKGVYDVSQWMDVFVTSGDYYVLTHNSPHNFYSTCREMDSVNGTIANGQSGTFTVDIPLFSSKRAFHRGIIAGPEMALAIKDVEVDKNALKRLELEVSGLPDEFSGMWVIYRGSVYTLHKRGDKLSLEIPGKKLNEFMSMKLEHNYNFLSSHDYGRTEATEVYRDLNTLLLAMSQGGALCFGDYIEYPARSNLIQVLIAAKSPEAFKCQGKQFRLERGYTLFHYDLRLPQKQQTGKPITRLTKKPNPGG